jgi:hypothetical protein
MCSLLVEEGAIVKRNAGLERAMDVDARLKELVKRMRGAEAEVARALLEMKRRGLYKRLGYSRISDYAEVELDLRRGKAKDLVEVAARCEELPKVRAAFEAGELPWTKARQVVRVATVATEEHWLNEARMLSNRGLESAVARAKGEAPKVRVTLELTPQDAADLDEAIRRLREERGSAVAVGAAVAELARRAMGAPVERPGYQVVIQQCATCGAASRDARGGAIEVAAEELAAAKVDAEIVDLTAGDTGVVKKTITPAERRAVIARDRGCCVLCGTRAWLHIHHVRAEGGVGALSLLCSGCHKGLVHAGHITLTGRAPRVELRRRDGALLRSTGGVT